MSFSLFFTYQTRSNLRRKLKHYLQSFKRDITPVVMFNSVKTEHRKSKIAPFNLSFLIILHVYSKKSSITVIRRDRKLSKDTLVLCVAVVLSKMNLVVHKPQIENNTRSPPIWYIYIGGKERVKKTR